MTLHLLKRAFLGPTHLYILFVLFVFCNVIDCSLVQYVKEILEHIRPMPKMSLFQAGNSLPAPWDDINLTALIENNLYSDLNQWGNRFQLNDFREFARYDLFEKDTPTKRMIYIRHIKNCAREVENVQILFPRQQGAGQSKCLHCDSQMHPLYTALQDAWPKYQVLLPEVVFMLNVGDHAKCRDFTKRIGPGNPGEQRNCSIPIFSLSKREHHKDILIPGFFRLETEALNHDWKTKVPRAMFRGSYTCGEAYRRFKVVCGRTLVAHLSVQHPNLLDAGFLTYKNHCGMDPLTCNSSLPVKKRIPPEEATRYKYLINIDGMVAAYRLANLMHTNSVILKQDSPWWEFYYRSLHQDVHYVSFQNFSSTDVVDRVQFLKTHDDLARSIANASQAFAMKYLSIRGRLLYWRYALETYKALFPEMETSIEMFLGSKVVTKNT